MEHDQIDRLDAGPGFRHVLRKSDVRRFLALLPGTGARVVLAPGEASLDGWHRPGVIAVCAWPETFIASPRFRAEHADVLHRLGVNGFWSDEQIRGFQLMAVLLREWERHSGEQIDREHIWSCTNTLLPRAH